MKLGRNIERDRDDVKFLAREGFITTDKLKSRYQTEVRSYIGSPETRTDPVIALWVEMIQEDLETVTKAKMSASEATIVEDHSGHGNISTDLSH